MELLVVQVLPLSQYHPTTYNSERKFPIVKVESLKIKRVSIFSGNPRLRMRFPANFLCRQSDNSGMVHRKIFWGWREWFWSQKRAKVQSQWFYILVVFGLHWAYATLFGSLSGKRRKDWVDMSLAQHANNYDSVDSVGESTYIIITKQIQSNWGPLHSKKLRNIW